MINVSYYEIGFSLQCLLRGLRELQTLLRRLCPDRRRQAIERCLSLHQRRQLEQWMLRPGYFVKEVLKDRVHIRSLFIDFLL